MKSDAQKLEEDTKKIESLGLSSLAGGKEDSESSENLQTKFLDNLRFRIDARIVKNLKI